jgi:hypothetical protein
VEKAEAELLCHIPKFCAANLTWGTKSNQANLLVATSALEDSEGATIPGLTLQLEIKKAIVTTRYQYELGLFKLIKGVRVRAYQLNVTPPDRRSHNGPEGRIYGPHQHFGTKHVDAVADNGFEDFVRAFDFYCKTINLVFTGNLNSPL